jgi:hypothetical protein
MLPVFLSIFLNKNPNASADKEQLIEGHRPIKITQFIKTSSKSIRISGKKFWFMTLLMCKVPTPFFIT